MLDGVLRRAGFLVERFKAVVVTADTLLAELQSRKGLRTPRQIETESLEQWDDDGGAPRGSSGMTRYTATRRQVWPSRGSF